MNRDTIHAVVSDFHSGSSYALFLDRAWQGKKTSVILANSRQQRIREKFIEYCGAVKAARKGKRLRIIHNGDAIDGIHHASGDICTTNTLEQADIHIELVEEMKRRVNWQRGDELYYTEGTEVHTLDIEGYIAEQLNASTVDGDNNPSHLKLEPNGVMSWFVHHGPRAGEGANEGNAERNWLKGIYIDALKDESKIPDVVYSGHVHSPTWACYEYRNKNVFNQIQGVILPSWQLKTRFARAVAPVQKNKIGGVIHEVTADGHVCIPQFIWLES